MLGVSFKSIIDNSQTYTILLASGITEADEGKALSLDTSAANTAKLAADDDEIIGYLGRVENRIVESELVGQLVAGNSFALPIKSSLTGGDVVALGSYALGAGSGEIKGSATATGKFRVVELLAGGTHAVVAKI